jgi:hypothetical protein
MHETYLNISPELLKINHYKAPRDKLICILNSCKVIFGPLSFTPCSNCMNLHLCFDLSGLIRHLHNDEGADSFIPILIYVVVKANPEHLLSNVESVFYNTDSSASNLYLHIDSLTAFEIQPDFKAKLDIIFRASSVFSLVFGTSAYSGGF